MDRGDRYPTIVKPSADHRDLLLLAVVFIGLSLLFVVTQSSAFTLREHVLGLAFEVVAAGLGMWLSAVIVWWARQRGRLDLFELPVWISLNAYVQVILNVWLLQRDELPPILFLRSYDYQTLATQAVVLMGVGLTALWAGYVWAFRRLDRQPDLIRPRADGLRLWPTIGVWAIGWIVGIGAVVLGVQGYEPVVAGWNWINYLNFISLFTTAAQVALMTIHFQRPSLVGWVWVTVVIVVHILTSLAVATRGAALIFIQLIIIAYYASGRLSRRFILSAIVALVVLVPPANAVRQALIASTSTTEREFTTRIGVAVEELANLSVPEAFDQVSELFRGRQGSALFTAAAVLLLHPTTMPYIGGQVLVAIPAALIPRALWPGKPTVNLEAYQTTELYRDAGTGGGTAIGLFSDAYRWGGWLVMVLLLFAVGALCAWLYQQGPGSRNFAGTAFYIALGLGIVTYDTSLFKLIMDLLQKGTLVWVITMFVLFYPAQRQAQSVLASQPGANASPGKMA
jgi:hypothetical protein